MKKSIRIVSICCLIFSIFLAIVAFSNKENVKYLDKITQFEVYAQENELMLDLEELLQGDKLIIVDFMSQYCDACREIYPVLRTAQDKYADRAVFLYVDVDKNPDMATAFNIHLIPAVFAIDPKTRDLVKLPVYEMQDDLSFENVFDQVYNEFYFDQR